MPWICENFPLTGFDFPILFTQTTGAFICNSGRGCFSAKFAQADVITSAAFCLKTLKKVYSHIQQKENHNE
jgi:hypothetical protein